MIRAGVPFGVVEILVFLLSYRLFASMFTKLEHSSTYFEPLRMIVKILIPQEFRDGLNLMPVLKISRALGKNRPHDGHPIRRTTRTESSAF
jgi:hypothetical protein